MKHPNIKRIFPILFFTLLTWATIDVEARTNEFLNPDFAFPADVSATAGKEYESAMKSQSYDRALLAAMQLNIADRLVTSDSIASSLSRYASVALKAPQPFRAIAMLLEARLLSEYYRSNRYTLDRRDLPPESIDSNPGLWSGSQFKDQISLLCRGVLEDGNTLSEIPLSRIALLLRDIGDGEKAHMSVYDFAASQMVRILQNAGLTSPASESNRLPIRVAGSRYQEKNASESEPIYVLGILDSLVAQDSIRNAAGSDNAEALLLARLQRFDNISGNAARIAEGRKLLHIYPAESEWRPRVIASLYRSGVLQQISDNDDTKVYQLIQTTLADHPDTSVRDCLKGYAADLTAPSLNITSDSQWLSDTPGIIRYTLRNATDCRLLLVPVAPSSVESRTRDLKLSTITAAGKITELVNITSGQSAPSVVTDSVTVSGLKPGYYAVVPSKTSDLKGVYSPMKSYSPLIINVSDLSLLTSVLPEGTAENSSDGKSVKCASTLYVVDARNNAPVSGAKVTFINASERNSAVHTSAVTKSDGSVTVPYSNCFVKVEHNGSRITDNIYNYNEYLAGGKNRSASLFTDLAIYHPGDTLEVAVVAANVEGRRMSPMVNQRLSLRLRDANYQEVACDTVMTDVYGRSYTRFLIPADGLTGTYSLDCLIGNDNIGHSSVQVADYKAPTFIVTLDKPDFGTEKSDGIGSDSVLLSGSVVTYSGMPLADNEVTLTISYRPMPWWRFYSDAVPQTFATTAFTDTKGRFKVTLDITALQNGNYEGGIFTVSASAVASTGESQNASPVRFTLRPGYHVSGDSSLTLNADTDTISIPVKVTDFLNNPVVRKVNYTVFASDSASDTPIYNRVAREGSFDSPVLRLVSAQYPSGRYRVRFVLPDAIPVSGQTGVSAADTLDMTLTLWRNDDVRPPYPTSVWLPQTTVYAKNGSKTVSVEVGDSFSESYIFCEISDLYGVKSREWLKLNAENRTVDVPSPSDGNALRVLFYGQHNLKSESGEVLVYPESEQDKVEIVTDTFRDKLTPLSSEKWRFRVGVGTDASSLRYPAGTAAIAVLSDAALNAITPFEWNYGFTPMLRNPYIPRNNFSSPHVAGFYGSLHSGRSRRATDCGWITYPDFNTWGYSLGGYVFGRNIRVRGTHKMAASGSVYAVNEMKEEMSESVELSAAPMAAAKVSMDSMADGMTLREEDSAEARADFTAENEDLTLRDISCPLAFFRPDLVADSDGNIDMEFRVPDFNTAWQFQLAAYTSDMKGSLFLKETVASKPVMISSNTPRFLLTGDHASVSALVFNNTDGSLPVGALLEIFDPVSGTILASRDFAPENIAASSSRTVNLDFDVPGNISAVGFRAVARSSRGSDGEQTLISVLPSSMPVTDAETFYMLPGQEDYLMTLPKMKRGDMVTLNFCANPAWYALTALSPVLATDSESAIEVADALCANGISSGLISRYPALRDGLASLFAGNGRDSLLVSPLEKNGNLKIASLNGTPWVNNAENQTLRMQSLYTLLDEAGVASTQKSLIDRLARTQNSDGSWSWMKKMPSSLYITCRVLSSIGTLKSAGYMPESAKLAAMVKSGIRYSDSEIGKEYRDHVYKYKTLMSLGREIDYFLMRGNITDMPVSDNLADMRADMLKRLPSEWRDLNIYDKASAAIVLYRCGKHQLASEIMESVRQFASYSDNKGMWFDNRDGVFGHSSQALTAHCLDALRVVSPEDKMTLQRMTQYLVLSFQTQDIASDNGTAATSGIVNSILSGFPGWTDASVALPVITIDGKPVALPESIESLTGGFYMDLDPEAVSGKSLSISRRGSGPAWGGVTVSRVAEVSEVKAASVPQLKVAKTLLPVTIRDNMLVAGKSAVKFSKGEKVRVTLTLVTDRDLDYVMVSDRRGAWMQPAGQLTEYHVVDGLWLLRETRNAATNFYITSLPKGKYVISYDVTADRDGEYSTGIATAESIYYPLITAHSAGCVVNVE